MKEREIYLQNKLKEINESMIELHIERRKLRKKLAKIRGTSQSLIKRENKRQQAIAESIHLLKSHPNKIIKSKYILQHLNDTINYNTDSFARIFRTIQKNEPKIIQIKRGYYTYED
ncbi:hypothetical protein CN902_06355 [Priestia megaterium]|uniref:Rok-like winged helix domain-containing protein n=1 Tax=Priestia megaterium TaxID=1404 RepID=UPI000BFBD501|nr:hypothetical protein [Priestia megaterium]PGK31712.1 hypothetical protein CN902_06355 [Priestia megaterium]